MTSIWHPVLERAKNTQDEIAKLVKTDPTADLTSFMDGQLLTEEE